jgi:hypothetical protein
MGIMKSFSFSDKNRTALLKNTLKQIKPFYFKSREDGADIG